MHYRAYQCLREALHNYIQLRTEPLLRESIKPIGAWDWKNTKAQTSYKRANECFHNESGDSGQDVDCVSFVQDGQ